MQHRPCFIKHGFGKYPFGRFMVPAILSLVFSSGILSAVAQTNSYQQTNLVSDMAGVANNTDPKLINPWGISFFPGQPFWIADNNSGYSTIYDANGISMAPSPVLIPAPPGDASPATPTGTVINQTAGFKVGGFPSQFLFDSEDGTISGWYNSGNAVLLVDRSTMGAVYKGLAMITNATGSFLLATNFHSGAVEVFDSNYNLVTLTGSFTDPTLPANYAPFGVQPIGSQVFVTYALQDSARHDPVSGAGNGYVSVFDMNGNFVSRFASTGTLNAPWGTVQASASFGMFSNNVLIGNFGDGTINAFDTHGNFLAQLKDPTGAVISNGSLWALVFGAGGTGDPNTLYFTAGLANEGHGLFGAIAASTQGTADYSLSASPQSGTVTAGGSMNFMLTITPANGFSSMVSFSCSAPSGITCSFNPATVTPAGGAASTTMTATASTGYGQQIMGMAFTGLGVFGCFLVGAGRTRRRWFSLLLCGLASLLIAGTLLAATGCSSYSHPMTNIGTASIVVTAQSGALTHSTTISLTVQ
jgi:uncharacterized protein (TIGR03118 family)